MTGSSNPTGDGFDIDYVAHEIGHQFGANHTFNGTTSGCGGGNRSASHAFEPGSGTTIMAYAGVCGAENLAPHSDDDFHVESLREIINFSTGGAGDSCDVETVTGNHPPVVNPGASFTIPQHTPFTLTPASVTDEDGDALLYDWDPNDLGMAAPPNTDSGNRPIFRSFVPSTSPSRTLPQLSSVLAGSPDTLPIGEAWPTTTRAMRFALVVRDNQAGAGGVDWAFTTVTSRADSGPFIVTAPNSNVTWTGSTLQTVTWNVANTNLAPVSCANVRIRMSSDGGTSFPDEFIVLETANDGSESINVPEIPTTTARLKVECVGNIFFDISNTNFTVLQGSGTPIPTNTPTITPTQGPVSTPTRTPTPTAPILQPGDSTTLSGTVQDGLPTEHRLSIAASDTVEVTARLLASRSRGGCEVQLVIVAPDLQQAGPFVLGLTDQIQTLPGQAGVWTFKVSASGGCSARPYRVVARSIGRQVGGTSGVLLLGVLALMAGFKRTLRRKAPRSP